MFVLHGTLVTAPPSAQAEAPPDNSGMVKMEEIAPLLRLLVQSVGDGSLGALNRCATQQSGMQSFQNTRFQPLPQARCDARFPPSSNTGNFCHYCSNPNCLVRMCPFIEEDVQAGRIMCNETGMIVLPNGNFVLRAIAGFNSITMRDRVYKWHHHNPNLLAPIAGGATVTQLMFGIAPETIDPYYVSHISNYQLMANDHITQLERELYALRQTRERFDGVYVPQYKSPRLRPTSRLTSPFRPDCSKSHE